jgi:Epoxide hydrolase N terminus
VLPEEASRRGFSIGSLDSPPRGAHRLSCISIREPKGDDVTHEGKARVPVGDDLSEIRPFRVEISDAAIDDLRWRLARTRWPKKEPVEDWSMGIPLAYVQQLAGYWAESLAARMTGSPPRTRCRASVPPMLPVPMIAVVMATSSFT